MDPAHLRKASVHRRKMIFLLRGPKRTINGVCDRKGLDPNMMLEKGVCQTIAQDVRKGKPPPVGGGRSKSEYKILRPSQDVRKSKPQILLM
eukprot:925934-Amphidinium_carterae.1